MDPREDLATIDAELYGQVAESDARQRSWIFMADPISQAITMTEYRRIDGRWRAYNWTLTALSCGQFVEFSATLAPSECLSPDSYASAA